MRPEELLSEASWKTLMKKQGVGKDHGLERALAKYKSSARDDPRGEKQVAALDDVAAIASKLLGEKEIRAKRELADYLDDLKSACRDARKQAETKADAGPGEWTFTRIHGSVGVIEGGGGSEHHAKVGEVLPASKKWLVVTPPGAQAELARADKKVRTVPDSLFLVHGDRADRARPVGIPEQVRKKIRLGFGKAWAKVEDMFGKEWKDDEAGTNAAVGVRG
jgi:hypothetical protein